MTLGSLFSGIGGLDLGLERAGFQVRWQCEIDPYARRVLAKHWPEVTRYGDIRELDDRLEGVDLIAGGFPCQPVSLAGRGRGTDDERWLWAEFARIIGLLRPRFVLVENSAALSGRGLGAILGDLHALGYDAEWSVVSACAMGAPHTRERLFVLGYADGIGLPRDVGRQAAKQPADGSAWAAPPPVCRVAHGVPRRVERVRGLGNAVVPQVAFWIGRRILAA